MGILVSSWLRLTNPSSKVGWGGSGVEKNIVNVFEFPTSRNEVAAVAVLVF